jgi:DNA-binding MarR family transcriptional regulator
MTSPSAPAPADRLVEAFEARLREVELVVGARIMESWAQAAELSLQEARLLLVVASTHAPRTASEVAARSGVELDAAYPALHRLIARGDIQEQQRHYSLTEQGQASVGSLDAARREGIAAYVADLDPDDRRRLEVALGRDAG